MKFYRGEVLSSHPKFPKGSAAEAGSSAMPVEITGPDIVYTKEDDEAIDRYNREIGEPALLFFIFCHSGPILTLFSYRRLAFGMLVDVSVFIICSPLPCSVVLVP